MEGLKPVFSDLIVLWVAISNWICLEDYEAALHHQITFKLETIY